MLRDAEKTIGNLIDKQRAAFISSVDEDGFPNTRAMLPPRKRVGIKTLYFSTNTSSAKVGQYRDNPKTCVYFCDWRFSGEKCSKRPGWPSCLPSTAAHDFQLRVRESPSDSTRRATFSPEFSQLASWHGTRLSPTFAHSKLKAWPCGTR